MSDFRRLSDSMFASPQLVPDDIAEAKRLGVTLIINNRPEGESPDQTPGPVIETLTRGAGLDYLPLPVTPSGFDETHVDAMANALTKASGPVLAYCRSGTRSTFLWALAQARLGCNPAEIAEAAAAAGYDIASIRPVLEELASRV